MAGCGCGGTCGSAACGASDGECSCNKERTATISARPGLSPGRTAPPGVPAELGQRPLECGTEADDRPAGLFPMSQARPAAGGIDTRRAMLSPRGAYRQRGAMAAAEDVASLLDRLRREGPPPGLLSAGGANLRARSTPRGELLRAARPARGRAISAAEQAQLPPELQRLWRARTAAMGPPPPSHGVPAGHLAVGSAAPIVDLAGWACACEGTYECALRGRIQVRYAEVDHCIDADWFWDHHDEQDWLDEDDTVAILWHGFKSHGEGVERDTFNEMLKCWMIDLQKAHSGRSYSLFFDERGGPREALYHACDLAARFQTYARESWSGVTTCEHFHNFVGQMFRGEEGTSRVYDYEDPQTKSGPLRHGPCQLSLLVVSASTDVTPRAVTTCERETPFICHEFTQEGGFYGGQFDDWSAVLAESSYYGKRVWQWVEASTSDADGPATDPLASASMTGFAVRLPATRIAWEGFRLDWVMYWARVMLQHALETGDLRSLADAWTLARVALNALLPLGDTLIHEVGHIFMGTGGHCDCGDTVDCACCFDMAATAWRARVSARLGLPPGGALVCGGIPLSFAVDNWDCGTQDGKTAYYPWSEDYEAPCVPSGDVTLEGGPCYVE